jgi:alpha-1,2-mannosyltransferase
MYAYIAARAVTGDRHGSDFLSFWQAGRAVLRGQSPYPLLDALPAVADRLTFAPFVYPAPAAYWLAPLAILPFAVAKALFLVLNLGSIVLALRLLGVRDWRCHAAVFASVPVVAGASLGTFSPLLLLGAAAAWRYRDRTVRVGLIVAALVVAKLFLWPLWFWLVYTRRFGAAALSAAAGVTLTVVGWWGIGFAGLHEYPQLLSRLTELVGTNSYSPYALIHAFGVSGATTQRLVLAGGALLAAVAAWRFRAVRTDERSFVAALGLALLLTPILWPHYLVLLYVPIALLRRSMGLLWLLPLLMWINGDGWSYGEPARIVPFLILCAIPFVLALRQPSPARREARSPGWLRLLKLPA